MNAPPAAVALCQPATVLMVVSVAGFIYNLLFVSLGNALWWVGTGVIGTIIFHLLCRGGLTPVAWILMLLPVVVLCFFLAVALFASRVRVRDDDPDSRSHHCSSEEECGPYWWHDRSGSQGRHHKHHWYDFSSSDYSKEHKKRRDGEGWMSRDDWMKDDIDLPRPRQCTSCQQSCPTNKCNQCRSPCAGLNPNM
jgi:hypothetical protein